VKKVYLIISIDTECDKDPTWKIPQPMQFLNISKQEDVLFPLFLKYNIKPTYLLSPEVIKHQKSVEFFKKHEDKIELGTHLHSEFIAPNENMKSTITNEIQLNLEKDLEYDKLKSLTNLFKNKFDFDPKSFRSGRFGSSLYTTSYLSELGYKVDSSVVPLTTKFFGEKYIDSWNKPLIPYWEKFDQEKILQVPLTLINPSYNKLPFFLKWNIGQPNSITRRIAKKIGFNLRTSWLRPFREDAKRLKLIADFAINNSFKNSDYVVLNIMFHSNEILPKGSPYCQNERDVRDFVSSLDQLFSHLYQKYQICSIGLSDLFDIYDRK
jgi:hypothetical protein